MATIVGQTYSTAWTSSASLGISGSATSGSFSTASYARFVGGVISNASSIATSGLRVYQSFDSGTNWDYWSEWAVSACSGSVFSIEIIGNGMKVDYVNGATAASLFRTFWQMRPV